VTAPINRKMEWQSLLTQLARPVGLGLKRQDGGLHAIMHLQLLQDIRHVMLDRFFRQVQLQPDLFIARAGRDQGQNFTLTLVSFSKALCEDSVRDAEVISESRLAASVGVT